MPSLNDSSRNSQIGNIATDYATAALGIYTGAVPVDANAALVGGNIVIVEHTLAGWTVSATGVITANAVANEIIQNTGTATFARLVQGANTMQLTIGVSNAELIVDSVNYVANGVLESIINSLLVTQPGS